MYGKGLVPILVAVNAAAFTTHVVVNTNQSEAVIATERAALDRWGKGDPQGYLETYAPEITYFDPTTAKRIDGISAMKEFLRPFAGKFKIDRYEMIDPKVQQYGDVAVLTFNLASHVHRPTGEAMVVRWNSTAVYRRVSGSWKMIHNHWSYIKPPSPGAGTP